VQDYPPISGYTMEPSLLARIARDVPAAHHQARGSADSGEDIAHPRADAGADRLNLRRPGWRLSVGGADGRRCRGDDRLCVSRDPRQIVRLFREERIDEAADVFYRKVPLMRFEFQDGIGMAIRKEVLRRRGAIASAAIRPPGGVLDQPTREALDRVLAWTMGSEGEH